MFLSRSGFELNETWAQQTRSLVEIDSELRELERREQSAPGDRTTFDKLQAARRRAGHYDAWMRPEVDIFNRAEANRKRLLNDLRHHYGKAARAQLDNAQAAVEHQRQRINDLARSIGRHAGEFIQPRAGEHHFEHMERVAQAHKRGSYSWDQPTMGREEKIHFFNRKEDRDSFAHSIRRHYGDRYHVDPRDVETDGYHSPEYQDHGENYRVHIRRHVKSPEFNERHNDA